MKEKGKKQPNPREVAWFKMYQRLVMYKENHNGSTKVPKIYSKDPSLGNWANTQRKLHNKNKLPQHRVELLDLIGFHWGQGPKPKLQSQWNIIRKC